MNKTPTAAIISIATELLPIEGTTLDAIHEAIRQVAGLKPEWVAGLDHKAAVAELARRRNVVLPPEPLNREAVEKLLTFDVRMVDVATADEEWTGPALELLHNNCEVEGDGDSVLEALAELARLPAGSSVLCGFFSLTRLPSSEGDNVETEGDNIENDGSEGVRVFAEHDDGDGLDAAEGIDDDLNDYDDECGYYGDSSYSRRIDPDQRAEARQMGFTDF